MTKKEAKRLCLIKWEYAKNTGCNGRELGGWLLVNHFEIYQLNGECAYCHLYFNYEYCFECPLYLLWGMSCEAKNSIWMKWFRARSQKSRIKYATQIYNDIKRS